MTDGNKSTSSDQRALIKFLLENRAMVNWISILMIVYAVWATIEVLTNASGIQERHRHRYEVNIDYKGQFEKNGLIFSGLSPDKKLPEIVELKNHPWFIAVQFHPEFKSRPLAPHPLFSSFIKAAKNHK